MHGWKRNTVPRFPGTSKRSPFLPRSPTEWYVPMNFFPTSSVSIFTFFPRPSLIHFSFPFAVGVEMPSFFHWMALPIFRRLFCVDMCVPMRKNFFHKTHCNPPASSSSPWLWNQTPSFRCS